jgi:transposase
MVGRRGDRERRRFWREVIGRQRASGLCVRAFCLREELSEPSFYAWRKRLAPQRVSSPAANAFAAVRVVDDSSPPTALAENILSPCANCVEIVLVDGVLVRVPPGADRQTLADVLAVLRAGTPTSGQHAAAGEESPAC